MGLSRSDVLTVTPLISAAAYSSGDQIGTYTEITNAIRGDEQSCSVIQSLVALSQTKDASAIDLMFFSDIPTLTSGDNDAISIADSEMASKFLGSIRVSASDWVDIAAGSHQTLDPKRIMLKNTATTAGRSKTSIWMVMVDRTGNTYAAGDFVFKLGLLQE